MPKTRKPCPSCKEVTWYRRDVGDICENCKNDRKRLEYLEGQFAKINGESAQVYYSPAPHWNQYFHTHGADDELQRDFYDLAEALITPYSGEDFEGEINLLGKGSGGSFNNTRGTLRRDAAEAFVRLHQSMQPLLDAVYQAGFRDGNNLLMRLANGDISPNQYLQKTKEES